MVDILAVRGDEGRMLSCDNFGEQLKQALTRRFPNGETRLYESAQSTE